MNSIFKKLVLTSLVAGSLGSAATAMASPDTRSGNNLVHNFYLGGTINYAFRGTVTNEDITDTTQPVGSRLFAGYQITDRWGVEAGYDGVDSETIYYPTWIFPAGQTSISIRGVDISGLVHGALKDGLDPFVRFGVAVYNVRFSNYHDDINGRTTYSGNFYEPTPVVGAGLNYVVRKRWPIGIEASYSPPVGQLPYIATIGIRTSVTV